MTDKKEAKKRMAVLKRLRTEHKGTVERTQAVLKEYQAFRKQLRAAMKGGPKTIPQIAEAAQLPSEEVMWHVMAMKKYDLVSEVGKDGDYYQYQLAQEAIK